MEGVAADPSYLDISVAPGRRRQFKIETTRNAFAYVFAGAGTFRDSSEPRAVLTESGADPAAAPVYDASNHSLVLFDRGDEITVQAGDAGIRFLLVSGKPIQEPVAWYGPIVMNTQEQIRQAIVDLQTGEFIKKRPSLRGEPNSQRSGSRDRRGVQPGNRPTRIAVPPSIGVNSGDKSSLARHNTARRSGLGPWNHRKEHDLGIQPRSVVRGCVGGAIKTSLLTFF